MSGTSRLPFGNIREGGPQRFVANMSKVRRKGRMFLDYLGTDQG